MKTSRLAAAAALACLVLAPIAQAQASCEDIANIVAAAEFDFEDILGDEEEADRYSSTLVLPGARECYVSYDWDSTFVCIWQMPDEASATRLVNDQIATMRTCLTDEWKEKAVSDDDSDFWRFIAGSAFSLAVNDSDELIFTARADATQQQNPVVYEVELQLTYIWF